MTAINMVLDHSGAAEAAAAVGRNLRAEVCPQPVQQYASALADCIPQGDVERRHGHRDDAATAIGCSHLPDRSRPASTTVASLPITRGRIVSSKAVAMAVLP
jgi:hypothetical protein